MVAKLEKEIPWCTIILVTCAMTCHIMVLKGNLTTAGGFNAIGRSTGGWSNVGLGLATAFKTEVDGVMTNMTNQLTEGLEKIVQIQMLLDTVIMVAGVSTDLALQQQQQGIESTHNFDDEQKLLSLLDTPSVAEQEILALLNKPSATDVAAAAAVAGAAGGGGASGAATAAAAAAAMSGNPEAAKVAGAAAAAMSGQVPPAIAALIPKVMEKVTVQLDELIDKMTPTLLQVGEWVTSFGEKLQAGVEQFSTTIDMVQKLFDQIMQQMNGGGDNDEYMELNTYTLFAVSSPEGISVQDLKDVSDIYSITALQGSKAEELHGKYDINKDALISAKEFGGLVADEEIPNIMAVVLRQYAKRLSQVSGKVKGAKLRDELANAVVGYLQLVCAKNITKVGWISDMLTNDTLPMAFTADIMRNLAMSADDPEVMTTADVGGMVIGMMTDLHPEQTTAAAQLMADTDFWVSEGFDPDDQPTCVERVTGWTAASLLQTGRAEPYRRLHAAFGGDGSAEHAEQLALLAENASAGIAAAASLARTHTERNRAAYYQRQHQKRVDRYHSLHKSATSRALFEGLLGGAMAYRVDPKAAQAVNSGVPAKPETLLFAKWLSNNATTNSQIFQEASFNYSGQSSSAMDSFATQIQGMVKKVQGFLKMLDEYDGPEGIDRLKLKVKEFADKGEEALMNIVAKQFAKLGGMALVEVEQPTDADTSFQQISTLLDTLTTVLPECIDNLKIARKEVSSVSATLDSIFDVFLDKGLPIFNQIASLYRTIWISWFLLLAMFTLGICYYGFWASGYFGGPKAHEVEEYEAPETCMDRLKCCWNSCTTCLRDCSETQCCFWSMLLLGQLFVLIIFIISLVLCLLAGVNMFISSGCAAVYVLGDEKTCTETLLMMRGWLKTYDANAPDIPIDDVCSKKDLTTCNTLGEKMQSSAVFVSVFSIVAAVFSFQMLVESSILHERARNRRMIDEMTQEKEKGANA